MALVLQQVMVQHSDMLGVPGTEVDAEAMASLASIRRDPAFVEDSRLARLVTWLELEYAHLLPRAQRATADSILSSSDGLDGLHKLPVLRFLTEKVRVAGLRWVVGEFAPLCAAVSGVEEAVLQRSLPDLTPCKWEEGRWQHDHLREVVLLLHELADQHPTSMADARPDAVRTNLTALIAESTSIAKTRLLQYLITKHTPTEGRSGRSSRHTAKQPVVAPAPKAEAGGKGTARKAAEAHQQLVEAGQVVADARDLWKATLQSLVESPADACIATRIRSALCQLDQVSSGAASQACEAMARSEALGADATLVKGIARGLHAIEVLRHRADVLMQAVEGAEIEMPADECVNGIPTRAPCI